MDVTPPSAWRLGWWTRQMNQTCGQRLIRHDSKMFGTSRTLSWWERLVASYCGRVRAPTMYIYTRILSWISEIEGDGKMMEKLGPLQLIQIWATGKKDLSWWQIDLLMKMLSQTLTGGCHLIVLHWNPSIGM